MPSASPPLPGLLEPSLTDVAVRPLLSPTATFFTAFLGGPWSGLVVAAVNVARARRLRRDAAFLVLGALLGVAALWLAAAVARPDLRAALPEPLQARWVLRRASDVLGLAVWAIFHLRLRRELRAAQLAGYARPWLVTIPAVVGGFAVELAAAFVAVTLR